MPWQHRQNEVEKISMHNDDGGGGSGGGGGGSGSNNSIHNIPN